MIVNWVKEDEELLEPMNGLMEMILKSSQPYLVIK